MTASPGRPAVRETPLLFGEDARLFGILAEPSAPVVADRPAVLLLNVGADSHVGPHRMNVVTARDLARRGYLTLRFDVGGLGESAAAPGERENRLYDVRAVRDVQAAMSAVERTRGVRRFVVAGLCSGAFLAFHATAADSRVVGQVLINMFAFEWKEGDPIAPGERCTYPSSRSYARSLLDRKTWTRLFRAEIDVRGIAAVLGGRVRERVEADARDLAFRVLGSRARTPIEREFHAICDRGVRSLMVFSDSDGGLDMITRHLGPDARRMARRDSFDIEIVSGVDHTFASLSSQRRLGDLVAKHVTAHFP